jgi:hypothetical protein
MVIFGKNTFRDVHSVARLGVINCSKIEIQE